MTQTMTAALTAYTDQGNNPPLDIETPRAHQRARAGQSSAAAVIENTTLRTNLFRHNCAFGNTLLALRMRNCDVDRFDLARFIVSTDILMDEVRGGYINAVDVDIGGDLTIRDSSLMGQYEGHAFRACINIPVHTLIERTRFGAYPLITDLTNWQDPHLDPDRNLPIKSRSITVRDSSVPYFKAPWVHTKHLRIERCRDIVELDLSHARVDLLEIVDTRILGTLDLSKAKIGRLRLVDTHIGATFDLSQTILGVPLPEVLQSTWSLLKQEGSNVRLPTP